MHVNKEMRSNADVQVVSTSKFGLVKNVLSDLEEMYSLINVLKLQPVIFQVNLEEDQRLATNVLIE